MCVSVYLYVLQVLGCSKEGINGQICLKFGAIIAWVSPWDIFQFFENFDFWALETRSWTLNGPKTFGVH